MNYNLQVHTDQDHLTGYIIFCWRMPYHVSR